MPQTSTKACFACHKLSRALSYLGPLAHSIIVAVSWPEDVIQKQTDDFKRKFCEFTELLDHLESLLQAKTKGRTPTRLRITTKPVVVCSEDEDLKIKWVQACIQGELLLIEVLLNHLEKVIKETRSTLRGHLRGCIQSLREG